MTTHYCRAPVVSLRRGALLLLLSGCSSGSALFDDVSVAGSRAGGSWAASGAGGTTDGGASTAAGRGGDTAAAGEGGDGTPPQAEGGAGGAPSPTPCTATGAETCNANDDDCNGIVDDGCPGGVSTTFNSDLPLLGDSPGGVAFSDDCQDGEVLSGLSVSMGAFLSQIHGVCRPLSLELASNAEHGYRVVLGAPRALGAHPEATTDPASLLACPNHEALVGLRLAQQHYTLSDNSVAAVTSRVWLSCAELVLSEHHGKLGVTWQGKKELAPASGSIANGTAWLVASNAPEGLVGSRLLGTSGSWIDRVGFGVSRLDVVLR